MALIDSEEGARRLARVIASDIVLYNRRKVDDGADLTAEVAEGFALFRTRVVPALIPVFETVLADRGLLKGKRRASLEADAPAAPANPPRAVAPAEQPASVATVPAAASAGAAILPSPASSTSAGTRASAAVQNGVAPATATAAVD